MSKGVDKRKAHGKKEQIMMAARTMYHRDGLIDATIAEVADEAGVSQSLVSECFDNNVGLVRSIAEWTLEKNLKAIREIDATPGLTLRQRDRMIHDLMGQNLEDWRLILRTFLVPALQIRDREELQQANLRVVLEHLDELREPAEESAHIYADSAVSLHIAFLLDGREERFQNAFTRYTELYLRPADSI